MNPTVPPMTSEQIVARLYEIKDTRAALNKKSEDMAAESDNLKAELIARLKKTGAAAVNTTLEDGRQASATVTMRSTGKLLDWAVLRAHILKTGEIDLLEKRLAVGAARERWQQGLKVPGVERVDEEDISLKAVKPLKDGVL